MALPRPLAVIPLGDCAAYVEFSRTLDLEVNALVQRLAAAVHARGEPWIRDVVPAFGGLALHFDPGFEGSVLEVAVELVELCIKEGLPAAEELGREVEVPVCYEREFAPDLDEVAKKTGLAPEEIARKTLDQRIHLEVECPRELDVRRAIAQGYDGEGPG